MDKVHVKMVNKKKQENVINTMTRILLLRLPRVLRWVKIVNLVIEVKPIGLIKWKKPSSCQIWICMHTQKW